MKYILAIMDDEYYVFVKSDEGLYNMMARAMGPISGQRIVDALNDAA